MKIFFSETNIMIQTFKNIHVGAYLGLILTILVAMTNVSSIFHFIDNTSAVLPFILSLHYLFLLLAIICYLYIITKCGTLLKQKLLQKYGFGLLYIVIGLFLLIIDFSVADGLFAHDTPGKTANILAYILVFGIIGLAIYLIIRGTQHICNIYILLAEAFKSRFFALSWKLLVLATLAMMISLGLYFAADSLPQRLIQITLITCYLSYMLGQLLFCWGAVKLKIVAATAT